MKLEVAVMLTLSKHSVYLKKGTAKHYEYSLTRLQASRNESKSRKESMAESWKKSYQSMFNYCWGAHSILTHCRTTVPLPHTKPG